MRVHLGLLHLFKWRKLACPKCHLFCCSRQTLFNMWGWVNNANPFDKKKKKILVPKVWGDVFYDFIRNQRRGGRRVESPTKEEFLPCPIFETINNSPLRFQMKNVLTFTRGFFPPPPSSPPSLSMEEIKDLLKEEKYFYAGSRAEKKFTLH